MGLRDRASRRDFFLGRRSAFVTAVAYVVVGAASLAASFALGGAAIVWPSAGVAFAATALSGPSVAVGVAVGAFLLRTVAGYGLSEPNGLVHALSASAAVAIAAALQALFGVRLVQRLRAFPFARTGARSVTLFMLAGACAGAFGALLVTLAFWSLGRLTPDQFPLFWAMRACQESLGIVAFAPVIVIWMRAPEGERIRRCGFAAMAALFALTAATAVFAIDAGAQRNALAKSVDEVTHRLAERIDNALDLVTDAVGGMAGVFETPAERNLKDFDAVARRVLAFRLGIQAIEWIPRVPLADRPAFEAGMREQWGRDYQIIERVDGKAVPSGEQADYFPVGYVYPLQGNEGALGYDLSSNADRRAALVAAEDTGQAVATAGVKLVQNGETGILLFVPVFNRLVAAETADLKGFALGVVAVPSLLDVALKGLDRGDVTCWLLDETDPGKPAILDSHVAEPPTPFRRAYQISRNFGYGAAEISGEARIEFAGRKWVLRVAPTAAYVARNTGATTFLILLGALALTSLVCGVALVQASHQRELVADREKALRDQKFALDQHAIVSITDADGRIVYANDKFCRTSGYPREQLIGRRHNIVRSDRHDKAFYRALWRTIASGEVWTGEICNRNASGELYWIQSTIVPVRDRDGEIDQFINISTNVTSAKRLELDLRSSEQRLAVALSAASTGLWDYDPASDTAVYSDTWYTMLGYQPGEFASTGVSFFSLIHPDDIGEYRKALDEHKSGRRSLIEAEIRLRRKDGSWTWIKTVGKAIERGPNGEPTRLIGVHRDVTNARAARAELAAARDAADRASQAKTDFLATMSHEIRTPMNGVIGMSALLEDTPLSPQQRRYVQTIRQSGEALIELIGDILDFTRLEAGLLEIENREFGPVSLAETVVDVLEPVASRKGIRLDLDIRGERVDRALGDQNRLRQILLNLTGNAVKFTSRGSVTVRMIGLSRHRIRFEVEDTGIGVPESKRARLFQVFSQVDASISRKYGGAGLGLAISWRLVKAMGGAIDFESREGVGSTFWFETPVGPVDVADAKSEPAARRRAALLCRAARGRKSALDVLAYCGFDAVEPAAAELVFVDFAEAGSASVAPPIGASKPVIVFGVEQNEAGPAGTIVIGGALTPARIRRALEESDPSAPAAVEPSASQGPAQPALNILVVDDTVTNQEVLGGLLGRLGHRVEIASDGLEAVKKVEDNDYDIVFMDVRMSGMDGLEATRRIRAMGAAKSGVRIVAMTAGAMTSDEQACRDAGMDDFVSKPVNRKKLLSALETVAARSAATAEGSA